MMQMLGLSEDLVHVNYCLFAVDCLNITEATGFIRGKHGSIDFLS
jgi:hypothetical protein